MILDLSFERIDEAYKTTDYSAVGFYLKCNFTPAEPPFGYKDTQRMYKVLRPKTD